MITPKFAEGDKVKLVNDDLTMTVDELHHTNESDFIHADPRRNRMVYSGRVRCRWINKDRREESALYHQDDLTLV